MRKKLLTICLAIVVCVAGLVVVPQVGTTVVEAKTKIQLDAKNLTLIVDWYYPNSLKGAKAKAVKWATNNKKVAVVNSKGKITAKKPGTAKVTATYEGEKYVCNVKVVEDLKYEDFNLMLGDEENQHEDNYIRMAEEDGYTNPMLLVTGDISIYNRKIKLGSSYNTVVSAFGDNSNCAKVTSDDRFAGEITELLGKKCVYTHTYTYTAESGTDYNKTFYYDSAKKVVAILLWW